MKRVLCLVWAFMTASVTIAAINCVGDSRSVVSGIYRQVFEREADPSGLASWSGQLDQGNKTVKEVVRAFAHSAEYKTRFVTGKPNADIVIWLYLHLLARRPESQEAINGWINQGLTMGWDFVIDAIIDSAEYRSKFGDNRVPGNPVTLIYGASAALQDCINATPPGGTLEIPAVVYRLDRQVKITKPITLRTVGTAGLAGNCLSSSYACARLQATPNLREQGGFLLLKDTSDVKLDHIILDGDRAARLSSQSARDCPTLNRWGFNASASNCVRCQFTNSASINALCGTGFEWTGDAATVTDSEFRGNGDKATNLMWADGLTLLRSNGARVISNRFVDNSDIGFISGGARDARFQNNTIIQSGQAAFAGLMLDNFNGTTPGDFTNTIVSGNNINCSVQKCDFGIEIGPHPWYLSNNIFGGTVNSNTVSGAKQGINVEGGGTAASPIKIFGNVVSGTPASATFSCGNRATSPFNISPDSVVDRNGETSPVTRIVWHNCL